MDIKKPHNLFLLTGILLGISWPHTGSLTFLTFFALIPALFAEYQIFKKRLRPRRVLWLSYLMFIVFNLITTWWIVNVTVGGAIMAIVCNSLLMALFFWMFHLVHRRYGHYWGYTAFVCIWMAFEYFHYNWELSWPWLNFGNAFANRTHWVQWYEYTGVGGGTLWILLTNLSGFLLMQKLYNGATLRQHITQISTWLLLILAPIIISLIMHAGYQEKKNPIDVVVVQPNIDPNGKFGYILPDEQLTFFWREAFLTMSPESTANFIIGPETALPFSIEESTLESSELVKFLKQPMKQLPKTELLIGMSSHRQFKKGGEMPDNVRVDESGNGEEYYNSALFISNSKKDKVYHKVKLVLGVEKIPFVKIFPFLESMALEMGGTSGTLGYADDPWYCFTSAQTKARIAPSICYESIYGEHMGKFITRDKANVIFVITNDGWWGDTPGYKQHFDYARLTAISLRRSIAQSANTGISGFIDQKGDIIGKTKWWTQCALRKQINLNEEVTFYAQHGDLLYRLGSWLGIAFIALYLYAYFTGKNFVGKGEV